MKHKKAEKELDKIFTNSDTVQIIRYDLDGIKPTYWATNLKIMVRVEPSSVCSWAKLNAQWVDAVAMIHKMRNKDALVLSCGKKILEYQGGRWITNFLFPNRWEEEKLKISSVLLEEQSRKIRICYNDRKVIAVNNKYVKILSAFFYGKEWYGNGEKGPIHCYDSEGNLLGLIMPFDMKNYKTEDGKDLSVIASLMNRKGGESND